MPCIFCEIISGAVPCKKIYEDEKVVGILDIYPAAVGHILLIPREHHATFTEMSEELVGHLGGITSRLALILVTNMKAQGVTTMLQQGVVAGQKSPHCIMHLIPRKEDDSLGMNVHGRDISQDELEQGLAKMRKGVEKEVEETSINAKAESEQENEETEEEQKN